MGRPPQIILPAVRGKLVTWSLRFKESLILLTQHYYAGAATQNTGPYYVNRLLTVDPDPPTSQDGLIGHPHDDEQRRRHEQDPRRFPTRRVQHVF